MSIVVIFGDLFGEKTVKQHNECNEIHKLRTQTDRTEWSATRNVKNTRKNNNNHKMNMNNVCLVRQLNYSESNEK